jgi:hypothetical protein
MQADEMPLVDGPVVHVCFDRRLPLEWPPRVVWLRFNEDARERLVPHVEPVRVDIGALLRPGGGEVIFTVPRVPAGDQWRWSFWDAEHGGRVLLRQERGEDDVVTGFLQLLAWWGGQREWTASDVAPVTIGVASDAS